MESIFNNGTLTVKPMGRVDTSNAAEVETAITWRVLSEIICYVKGE